MVRFVRLRQRAELGAPAVFVASAARREALQRAAAL